MVKLMKKMVMAGLGAESKAREALQDLVRRGEDNQADYAKKVKGRVEFFEEDLKRLEKKERELIGKLMDRLPIATKADLNRLEKKIQDLSARLKNP